MTDQETVIVVEDDPSMLQALERLLHAAGLEASTFVSAESLLESGAAATAGCFVFDVHLPGLSGIELLQQLVERGIRRPAIFITAHDEPTLRQAAERYGPADWLLKPFSGRSLLDAIARATRSAHATP